MKAPCEFNLESDDMIKRTLLCVALFAALALTACGGDSGSDTTTPNTSIDRIEPLDTALPKSSVQAKAEPVAVSRMPPGAAVARIALGPLVGAKMTVSQDKGARLQIGQGRAVQATASPADLADQLRWNTLADGTQVAALAFSADGAQAIRLGVLARRVPAGAVLRFYGADGADVVEMPAAQLEQLRQINEEGGLSGDDARMVWGATTAGSVSVLEVQLPAGADAGQLQLAVPQLAHFTQTVQQAMQQPAKVMNIGSSGGCNLNVVCEPELQAESRAVAKMSFVSGGTPYLCTGTLMNDAKASRTPYFLTANHCISTQAEASTLTTYWFFRAATCDNPTQPDPAMTYISTGAKLLYTETASDATLLQLNFQIPEEKGVVYAGSYFGAGLTQGTGVTGVHNPAGDLQKYSVGSVTGYATCTSTGNGVFNCPSANSSTGQMYMVGWKQGTTEGGSSGSAIFAQLGKKRYVTGTLTAGSASCLNPNGTDNYGRFDRAYSRGIKAYLNP